MEIPFAIGAALVSASCATVRPAAPTMTPAGVRFMYARPDARTVAVAGSFNEWSTSSHPLVQQQQGGPWMLVVALEPGEYTFMYVVNGSEWVSPLAGDYVDDGFGSKNGVIVVSAKE